MITPEQVCKRLVDSGNGFKTSLNDHGMKYVKQADEFPPDSHMAEMGLKPDDLLCAFANKLIWGTLGQPAKYPVKYKFLYELDSEHLRNILATQRQIPVIYSRAILFILQERSEGRGWKRRGELSAWGRCWRFLNAL